MKTFIRTIVVFVALSLAAGSLAVAQNAHEKEDMERAKEKMEAAKIEMKQAAQKMKGTGQKMKEAELARYMEAERARKESDLRLSLAAALKRSRRQADAESKSKTEELLYTLAARTKTPRHAGRVLVIPAAKIKLQDLVTIMEDMRVMSRIFDKKLDLSQGGMFPGGYGGYGSRSWSESYFPQDSRETEGIYLDGYGALFLIKVNFPLSPPPKVQEEEIEEEIDPLWEETKQEIYTPEDVGRRKRRDSDQKYDAEKVEALKRRLIKSLKHAANIRNLNPDEWVILTVAGSGVSSGVTGRVILSSGQILVKDNDNKLKIYEQPLSSVMGFSSPTVLTIRARKSDVDAFSKDKLDFDQFRKKVQIFTY